MNGFALGAAAAAILAALAFVVYDTTAISVIDATADHSVLLGGTDHGE